MNASKRIEALPLLQSERLDEIRAMQKKIDPLLAQFKQQFNPVQETEESAPSIKF